MRPYIFLVVIAVLVAGLAALAVRKTVPRPPMETAALSKPVKTVKILVAQENIAAGSFVRADKHMAWSELPAEKVKSPPYLVEGSASMEDFNGAVARRAVFAGEPITKGTLVKPGDGGFMSAVLHGGQRAVSVPVNATTGNAGFIFPGDQVDLILTHTLQNGSVQSFASETFVEDVRVLAVDQSLDNPENKALLAKTVTLEVSPHQAEAINVAMEMGKISLSLRSLAAEEEGLEEKAANPPEAESLAPASEPEGIALFYPQTDREIPRNFTRDSDISKLLGSGGEGPPTRVRLIRGGEAQDLEFRQTTP